MTIKNITSLTNQEIKEIYKKIHSNNHKLVMIESQKVFNQINDDIHLDYLICTQDWYDLNKKHKYIAMTTLIVTQEIIDKLSFIKNNHSKVIYLFEYYPPEFKIQSNQKYIILDNIQDPSNLANIIRTSVAFNCNELFISKNSVSVLNDKVIRASVGSFLKIKVIYYANLNELIHLLKSRYKYKLIASCLCDNAIKLSKFKTKLDSFALIMGNEGNGLDKNIIKQCDFKLMIDIFNIDSLNVSNAYAILIYWLLFNSYE